MYHIICMIIMHDMMFTQYVCANNCNQAKQDNQWQEHRRSDMILTSAK